MSIEYGYDEDSAAHADDHANRIDTSGAYVVKITKAEAVLTQKGTAGVLIAIESAKDGTAEFTLYTRKEDGTTVFGKKLLDAIQTITGLRGLRSAPGPVMRWDEEAGERVEVEGEVFPDLLGKSFGAVLQREDYTNMKGNDAFRLNLAGSYHPETRLVASEMIARTKTPVKLDKILRGLKPRDTRKSPAADQPSMSGLPAGEY